MLKFDYEYPELEEALFGSFVCGDTPGSASMEDDDTEVL